MLRLFASSTILAAMAAAPIAIAAGLSPAPAEAASAEAPAFTHVSCRGVANEVQVEIHGVKENVGLMVADLYREDDDGFLKRSGRVHQVRFAAKSPVTQFCMRAPEAGKYAMAVYHDENANKTLDRGAFGIPAEPYGISNDPVIRFGPPSLEESLFQVSNSGTHVEINLKN